MDCKRRIVCLVATLAILPVGAFSQNVISLKSGLVQVADGDVSLNGKALQLEPGQFPQIPVEGVLKTGEGRTETLLTPGVFLRSGAASSLRVLNARLSDTQVELLTGKHDVEVVNLEDDNAVTLRIANAWVSLDKPGIYRFDADAGEIRTYDGKIEVHSGDASITLKKGRMVKLANGLQEVRFDPDTYDGLMRWTSRRSKYIAMANLSAAHTASGGYSNYGGFSLVGGWIYNPYLGLMTYLPSNGFFSSPFGYYYYSPRSVYNVYNPPPVLSTIGGGASNPGGLRGGYDASRGYTINPGRTAATGGFGRADGASSGSSISAGGSAAGRNAGSASARGGAVSSGARR